MAKKNSTMCVLGMGYIGFPTACLFGRAGVSVTGVDSNRGKIELLQKGILPFKEKGIDVLFGAAKKNLSFKEYVVSADVFLIAVPTPITKQKKADLSYVRRAIEMVASVLQDGNLVIIESTVSPGCSAKMVKPILDRTKKKYLLAHCPERAIPGAVVREMIENDRIIGGINDISRSRAAELYRLFVRGSIFETDIATAEVVKLAENTYRDINIAYANELAKFCEGAGINVHAVINLANRHPRVTIHTPGPGVGGHCIAQDPWFLVEAFPKSKIIKSARQINDAMPYHVGIAIAKELKRNQGTRIGILGVAYKKNVDDARETPAHHLALFLKDVGCDVRMTDPHVNNFAYPLYKENEVLSWADMVAVVADHDVYRKIDFRKYPNIKTVFDTRNMFSGKIKGDANLITLGIGKT